MARFRRLETLQTIVSSGLVPIFYNSDRKVAMDVARAVHRGGSRILEFTNRGVEAVGVFGSMVRHCSQELPDLILGIGTVSDPATAALYLSMGADFVVSPVLSPEVIRVANRRKVPVLPGCGSATEIATAEEVVPRALLISGDQHRDDRDHGEIDSNDDPVNVDQPCLHGHGV